MIDELRDRPLQPGLVRVGGCKPPVERLPGGDGLVQELHGRCPRAADHVGKDRRPAAIRTEPRLDVIRRERGAIRHQHDVGCEYEAERAPGNLPVDHGEHGQAAVVETDDSGVEETDEFVGVARNVLRMLVEATQVAAGREGPARGAQHPDLRARIRFSRRDRRAQLL